LHPRKVGRLLATDPDLQPVVAKAREISALAKLCVDFLPPGLGRQLRATNLKDGQLVVLAATPAAAAKLKLLSESLRKFLSEQGRKVNAVSVRVQPGAARELIAAPRQPRSMPPAGVQALTELHRRLADSPAREALKRLLEHQAGRATSSARPSAALPPRKRR
jgi:hypothetical protein